MKRKFMNKMIISLTVVVLAGALAGCSGTNDASDPSESSAYESEDIEVPQSFEETESSESESAIQTETEAEAFDEVLITVTSVVLVLMNGALPLEVNSIFVILRPPPTSTPV